jgi:hypothetical protein
MRTRPPRCRGPHWIHEFAEFAICRHSSTMDAPEHDNHSLAVGHFSNDGHARLAIWAKMNTHLIAPALSLRLLTPPGLPVGPVADILLIKKTAQTVKMFWLCGAQSLRHKASKPRPMSLRRPLSSCIKQTRLPGVQRQRGRYEREVSRIRRLNAHSAVSVVCQSESEQLVAILIRYQDRVLAVFNSGRSATTRRADSSAQSMAATSTSACSPSSATLS